MGSDLLDQISSLFGRKRFGQLLFGHGQCALETNHEKIADQKSVNVLGSAAHVFLFEAADAVADRRFDFALCFHRVTRQDITTDLSFIFQSTLLSPAKSAIP